MLVPVALWATPVKVRVVPRSMDALVAGVRLTDDGTGKKVAWVGLLPQPLKAADSMKKVKKPAICEVENLPKTWPPREPSLMDRYAADGKLSV